MLNSKPISYRKDIQGLRAIAVLAVWIFHIDKNILPGGFIGVDIFFVISGYIISLIIWKKKENNTFSFIDFYYHRFRRIVPAYYFMLLLAFIATAFVVFGYDIKRTLFKDALLFISNVYFSSFDNYFGAKSYEQILLHTWSLSIEMQFYFILPFCLYFISKKRLLICVLILIIGLIIYSQYKIVHGDQQKMYFSLLARIPEFLIGVLVAGWSVFKNLNKILQSFLGFIGLIMIGLSLFVYNESTLFPGLAVLLPCFGTALLLGNNQGIINTLLSNKILVFFGDISYSIYLWHWFLLAIVRYYLAEYHLGYSITILLIVLTFIISYFSYRYVENMFKNVSIKKIFLCFSIYFVAFLLIFVFVRRINNYFYSFPENLVQNNSEILYNHNHYDGDLILGDTLNKNPYLLIGNSKARVMKTFLDIEGKQNHFSFRVITNSYFPTLPGFSKKEIRKANNFGKSYEMLIPIVDSLVKISPVIFYVLNYIPEDKIELIKPFNYVASQISDKQDFIIISDFPSLDVDPIRKNRSVFHSKSRFIKTDKKQLKLPVELNEFIKNHSNFHYIDLSDSYVFNNNQFPYFNDTIMYYDKAHLNTYGATKYAKFSGQKFMINFNKIRNKVLVNK
ncbi:acyltransferase family protein [Apibacter sp. HY039]|uniref:acyltransferase family protein n=1 Tax=Apibacter sp. HY039 TaxID=2501476 RepID=UPI000FEB8354|nr:acyltransferase family protein [Apibacter sp. HY039]